MRVVFIQTKNGLLALTWRWMKSTAAAVVSSSIVSMRFLGQWSGVLDGLLADLAEAWIDGRIVMVACLASQHAARPELGLERRIFWVIRVFRVFLGIEVIEVAEELIEAMHGRQVFIAVAEMVLAELAGGIAERLERLGDSDIARLQANGGARNADLGEAGADNRLPSDEA